MLRHLRWWLMRRFFKEEGAALYDQGRREEYVDQFLFALRDPERTESNAGAE